MKFLTIFLLMFIVFSSCDESNSVTNTCSAGNQIENLAFLKDAKNTIDKIDCGGNKSSITQYTYNSETVFEVVICNQIADGQTLVYNCSGEKVCVFGGIAGENTCPDFYDKATDKIILYGN